MKFILSFSLSLIALICHSQSRIDSLEGDWIAYKIEMVDGSKLVDRFVNDSSFIKFTFAKSILSFCNNPLSDSGKTSYNFKIVNNWIMTAEDSGYLIEGGKIGQTMILNQMMTGAEKDKLKRFYVVRQEILSEQIKLENPDTNYLVATKYFTPTSNKNLEAILNSSFKDRMSNFKMKGKLVIDTQNKIVTTTIFESDSKNKSTLSSVEQAINNSYNIWNIQNFIHYKNIEISFVLKCTASKNWNGFEMEFFTNSFKSIETKGDNFKNTKSANDYFLQGVEAFQSERFEKSILLFSKSLALDPINIDALYNRATAYYKLGNFENACADWTTLKDKGQVRGITLYNEYCLKK